MESFISSANSENIEINELRIGNEIEICGMVYNTRITKWGGFVILRTPHGLLQTVFQNENSKIFDKDGNPIKIGDLSRESAINLIGVVNAASIKDISVFYKTIEVTIDRVVVLSVPSTANLVDFNSLNSNSEANFTVKVDNRQITLRNPRDMAIFKVSAQITKLFVDYLTSKNFTQIFSPKIVSEGAEGGANVFSLDYFGKKAYLAQ